MKDVIMSRICQIKRFWHKNVLFKISKFKIQRLFDMEFKQRKFIGLKVKEE